MAEYLTTDTELTSIADAIRSKGGTSDVLTYPTEFINAINAIETTPATQSKSISPTEAKQTVLPDTDYLLSSVTVNAIPSDYIGSNIPTRSTSDVVASGSVVTVPSGYYTSAVSTAIASGAFGLSRVVNSYPSGIMTVDIPTGQITITTNSQYYQTTAQVTRSGYMQLYDYVQDIYGVTIRAAAHTYQLSTQSAATYTPSSATQTIPSGIYLTGVQTIEPVPIGVIDHRLVMPEGLIGV